MKGLSVYYLKYKKILFPVIFLVFSFFLIFRVILPQISNISDLNREKTEKTDEINALKSSLQVVSGINEAEAQDNLTLTTRALPNSKDISLIFSALSSAASASDTELRDFSLKIGGVFGRADKATGVKGIPTIDVAVTVSSSTPSSYMKFSQEVQKRLPLAEVQNININKTDGEYDLAFYYKPYDIISLSRQDKIMPLNQADINLLNVLKDWDK